MNNKSKYTFFEAKGPINFSMTNDAFFHLLLQENEVVRRALICDVLQLRPEDVKTVEIKNPILPRKSLAGKTMELDVLVKLTDGTVIDLELQVVNEHNWSERSLMYTSRLIGQQLGSGEKYDKLKPVMQISFLNFTPFPEYPEFYSLYQILNVKNHHLYTDKFAIHVINLNKIELATDEDRERHLDQWARFFKVQTWEELIEMTKENEVLTDATQTAYDFSRDDELVNAFHDREDYYRRTVAVENYVTELEETVTKKDKVIAEKDAKLVEQNELIEQMQKELDRVNALKKK